MKKITFSVKFFVCLAASFVIIPLSGVVAQDKNITFSVDADRSEMDYPPFKTGKFKPGNFLHATVKKFPPTFPASFKKQKVIAYLEVATGDAVIHRHAYKFDCPDDGWWKFNLMPDPDSNVSIVFRHDWNGNFARALGKLAPGVHMLKVSANIEKDGQRIQVGYGEIQYDNSGSHKVNMNKIGDLIDKKSTFDPQKEMAEWIKKNGGEAAWRKHNEEALRKSDQESAARNAKTYYNVIAKNNCNSSFTLTVNDKQTYIISGRGTVTLEIFRGRSGLIKRNGVKIGTVYEKNHGSTIIICK